MQNLNAIPLSALRTVEAILRNGTLARAAGELGVTPGALSQRLAKAEQALGQPLFLRHSKGLTPTRACADIAPRLTRAMTDLSDAVATLQQADQDVLTVSVAPIFANRWLIWRISRFNAQNPGISLRVFPTVDIVDLDRSEVDIGIRIGRGPHIGRGAIKLLDQRVFPVCAPELARDIHGFDDLLRLPVIRENEHLAGWAPWLEATGTDRSTLRKGPTYADGSLCLDAAMTGQGVFMAWETLACDTLERGLIAAPLPQRYTTGATYWCAINARSKSKPAVRKFYKWLQAELSQSVQTWQDSPPVPERSAID